ncbi:hypothetical protein D3C71_1750550 [compost metagenome]
MEFHQRRQIGKAHVVGARSHALHRSARAAAGIDLHVQAFGLEQALGHRMQEERRRALEAPVELELDRRIGRMGGNARQGEGGRAGLQEETLLHGGP